MILAHFEHVSQTGSGQAIAQVKGRATFVVNILQDLRVIAFMQDMLQMCSKMSLRFQMATVMCVDFLDAQEAANLEMVLLQQG